jgi:hypothetical protein
LGLIFSVGRKRAFVRFFKKNRRLSLCGNVEKIKMKNEDKIKFLWDVIKRYDGYIGSVNAKVALLLSFCTAILVGIILKTKDIVNQFETECAKYVVLVLVCWIVIFNIKSIYHLLKTVFPLTNSYTAGSSLIFFGDVAKTEKASNGYHQKVHNLTEEQAIKDLSCQVYELSLIASDKFEDVKKSVSTIKVYILIPTAIFMILVSIL